MKKLKWFYYAFGWALVWQEFFKWADKRAVVDSRGNFHANNMERAIKPLVEMPRLNVYSYLESRHLQ